MAKSRKHTKKLITTLVALTAAAVIISPRVMANATQKKQFQLFNEEDGTDIRVTFYTKKDSDKVIKQTTENRIGYAALKESTGTDDLEVIKEQLSQVQKSYQDIKGVTETLTYRDHYVLEKVVIDYTKADPNKVVSLAGAQSQASNPNAKVAYISYKSSSNALKEQGFTEVKNGKFQTLKNVTK
ncbi:DUF1307 domain-containing protein [Streptococcus sp. zg-JUN1979]|uniref:DUF1307 domain-containing protein n=1 Tax=Streptococcus sp. zg-JUN1979 TaxID=3391450 RepID=UPI0039A5F179